MQIITIVESHGNDFHYRKKEKKKIVETVTRDRTLLSNLFLVCLQLRRKQLLHEWNADCNAHQKRMSWIQHTLWMGCIKIVIYDCINWHYLDNMCGIFSTICLCFYLLIHYAFSQKILCALYIFCCNANHNGLVINEVCWGMFVLTIDRTVLPHPCECRLFALCYVNSSKWKNTAW